MRGVIVLLFLTGCRQLLGFEQVVTSDGSTSPISCEASADMCPPTAPICAGGRCVECTSDEPGVCTGAEPSCNTDQQCRACAIHQECASSVCLADGSCASTADVAYVEPDGQGSECTLMLPCGRLQTALATPRLIIKLTGTVSDPATVLINRAVDIYGGPNAMLTRSINGIILEASNTATIGLHGIAVSGATSTTGIGLRILNATVTLEDVVISNNGGVGIDARNEGALTMRRCIVSNNLQGGLDIQNVPFAITNTLITGNGNAASNFGGLRIKPSPGLSTTFELNTIADNLNSTGSASASGVDCDQEFDAHSNIVVGNSLDDRCTFDHSLFDSLVSGVGNREGKPGFISTQLGSVGFYRIGPGSEAIDGAISTILFDIDDQPRPVGTAPDMGADELDP